MRKAKLMKLVKQLREKYETPCTVCGKWISKVALISNMPRSICFDCWIDREGKTK